MDKKIEDYLHLYLGCCYRLTPKKYTPRYKSSRTTKVRYANFYPLMDKIKNPTYYDFKLILRPLGDMTEEEGRYVVNHYSLRSVDMPINKRLFGIELSKRLSGQMEVTKYLLSKHFDLFGLIPAGLAIDATTLKK